jgi:hypothetical protein
MPDDDTGNSSPAVQKFRLDISEIAALIKLSDDIGADISEGRRLLLISINMGKTSKNFDIIVKYLSESRSLMENAIEETLVTKLKNLRDVVDAQKDTLPDGLGMEDRLQQAMESFRVKRYETTVKLMKGMIEDLEKLEKDKEDARRKRELAPITPITPTPPAPSSHPPSTVPPAVQGAQKPPEAAHPPTLSPAASATPVFPTFAAPVKATQPPTREVTPVPSVTSHQPQAKPQTPVPQTEGRPQPLSKPSTTTVPQTPLKSPGEPREPKYTIEKTDEMTKCSVCMGKIKPGFTTMKCRCGTKYHEMCGKRVGKCRSCGETFD